MPEEAVVNPFAPAGKVAPEKFVGRVRELAEIKSRLSSRQNVSVVGPSRIGKSSLLSYVCQGGGEILDPATRYVYLDLQRISGESHFWQEALGALGGSGQDPDDLLDLSKKRPVVLCIDEFDKASDVRAFSVQFWQSLRSYAQEQTLSILMATSRPLKDIEPDHPTSEFANIFSITRLGELPEGEARQLIDSYLAPTGVAFDDDETAKLIAGANGHPAHLQAACRRLFDQKLARSGQDGRYEASSTFTTDAPQVDDWLWNGVYSHALADFIAHEETSPPLVIGINAPWGAGKSSLMKAVRHRLDPKCESSPSGQGLSLGELQDQLEHEETSGEPELELTGGKAFPTVWFNAWKYAKDEQLWAALVQCILRQLTERMAPMDRERFFLRLNLRRVDQDKVRFAIYQGLLARVAVPLIVLIAALIATCVSFVLSEAGWKALLGLFNGPATGPEILSGVLTLIDVAALVAVFKKWRSAKKNPASLKLADYVKRPQYDKKVGFLGELEDDLHRLQELIADQRLVIFVDDLDRCPPRKVVELIEAVNVFFGMEPCRWIFVLGLDADFVEASIESNYEKLISKLRTQESGRGVLSFGRHFLEKIVQVWLTLPAPEPAQMESYLKSVLRVPYRGKAEAPRERVEELAEELRGQAHDLDSAEAAVRERRKTLDEEDRQALEEAGQQVAAECFTERDPELRSILTEALAYLEKNPRQVKRFLNLFRLAALVDFRTRRFSEPGLPQEHCRRLAKWVALSLRFPRLARRVKVEPWMLERLEEAAPDEAAWNELAKEPGWDRLLGPEQRQLLKAGIPLHRQPIDFDVLA